MVKSIMTWWDLIIIIFIIRDQRLKITDNLTQDLFLPHRTLVALDIKRFTWCFRIISTHTYMAYDIDIWYMYPKLVHIRHQCLITDHSETLHVSVLQNGNLSKFFSIVNKHIRHLQKKQSPFHSAYFLPPNFNLINLLIV